MLTVMFILTLAAGEPDVLWSAVSNGGVYCSADMGDLNGDGVPDVVCGLYYSDPEPTLHAVSGQDGSSIWSSSSHQGIYQDEGFKAVPDFDGDGRNDLLMGTPGGYAPPGRCLYLVSGTDGQTIMEWAACQEMGSNTGWGYSCCMGDDISGDEKPEFYGGFGTTGSSGTGLIACVDAVTGDAVWTMWQPDAVETLCTYEDVNEDGYADVLAGIGGNHYTSETARLFSGANGTVIWQRDPGGDCMSVSLADRIDTWPLAVFCTWDGTVACYDGGGMLQWDYAGTGWYMDVHCGPDVNGDGTGDVALAADNAGVVCLSGEDGTVLWTYPSGSNTWSVAWLEDVILQGTPVDCVAAGSVNGRSVTLINAVTGEQVWEMPFSERVYNVSAADLGYPSPVVIAGLQDQTTLPDHLWALASSLETGIESSVTGSCLETITPWAGAVRFTVPGGEPVPVDCFDLTGRTVFSGTYAEGQYTVPVSVPGIYLLRPGGTGPAGTLKVTVL